MKQAKNNKINRYSIPITGKLTVKRDTGQCRAYGIPVSRDEKSFGRGNLSRGTVISRDENLVAWEGKRVAWEIIIYM
jgi:hypothetical protein